MKWLAILLLIAVFLQVSVSGNSLWKDDEDEPEKKDMIAKDEDEDEDEGDEEDEPNELLKDEEHETGDTKEAAEKRNAMPWRRRRRRWYRRRRHWYRRRWHRRRFG